ncbi:MAG: hypothetical protein U9R19_15455 [Bacteroidota bacterium]|nr:hypothetical protein [Bacteroidota bacterium]
MRTKVEIEKEVEKTLESTQAFERYDGKPFLLTRIQAKLENKQEVEFGFFAKRLPRLVLQPYLLVFVVVINIFSAFYFFKNNDTVNLEREQYIDQLAEEFSISTNNYYLSTLIEGE